MRKARKRVEAPAPYVYVPPTPEQQLASIVRTLQSRAESALKTLDKFRAEVERNAQYAMDWSSSAFDAAGQRDVALRALDIIDHLSKREAPLAPLTPNEIIDAVTKDALKEALREARYPSSSTSGPSNWAKRCRAAAAAELYENLTSWWRDA